MAINPDANKVYVANSGDISVSVINGTTDKVKNVIPVGKNPSAMAINRISNKVYVANGLDDNTVSVIDGNTDKKRST
jgi:YVTN family beta-propeller protein